MDIGDLLQHLYPVATLVIGAVGSYKGAVNSIKEEMSASREKFRAIEKQLDSVDNNAIRAHQRIDGAFSRNK